MLSLINIYRFRYSNVSFVEIVYRFKYFVIFVNVDVRIHQENKVKSNISTLTRIGMFEKSLYETNNESKESSQMTDEVQLSSHILNRPREQRKIKYHSHL